MKIKSLNQIETIFKSHGITEIFIKELSKKQDNEKNQIYLGGTNGISNLFPYRLEEGSTSQSIKKSQSSPGKKIVYANLNFYWLDNKATKYNAPDAKNIIYFQYAKSGEVRLSAFLKNCNAPLDCLRREKQLLYGQRILILGFSSNGETFGLILNERDDFIVTNFPKFENSDFSKMIQVHSFGPKAMSLPDMKKIEAFYLAT